ncbi:mitogen-activated protein kinase kinase kinase 3 isoform X1 [Lissotriton helveticus]
MLNTKRVIPIKPSLPARPGVLLLPGLQPVPTVRPDPNPNPPIPGGPEQPARSTVVSEVGSTPSETETMVDQVIQTLIDGQQKLEWAISQQISTADADRALFRSTMTQQMDNLQKAVQTPGSAVLGDRRPAGPHPARVALQKYVTGEDPDAFLVNFERAARACGWPEEKWPFFLAPLLTGEAQTAYQVANHAGTSSYTAIKEVILDHLGMDAEAYRIRFRKEKGVTGENPKTLYLRLKMAAEKWLRPDDRSKEEVMTSIVLEQFMEALPYGTQRWLRQHPGLTAAQAIEMAANYTRAAPRSFPWETEKTTKTPVPPHKTEKKKPVYEPLKPRPFRAEVAPMRGPQCFECGEWGHIARMCPRKKPVEEPMEVGYIPKAVLYTAEMGPSYYVRVLVNHAPVKALLDSGCRQSVIRESLLVPSQIGWEDKVHIRCVHGDVKAYPIARISIKPVEGEPCTVRVGVVASLPEELILGVDNPHFLALFKRELANHPVEAFLSAEPWVIDKGFKFAQANDPTLLNAWEAAHVAQTTATAQRYPRFRIRSDLLYREGEEGDQGQLVVPKEFREQILFYAHTHLTAGHSGAEKTTQNILRLFYWPGIYKETEAYCQRCEVCQRKNLTKPPAVPLQPLPIIGNPWERVGMDIIGPLPRTTRGHTYALVIVDYSTRFPEAYPLTTPTTKNVAEKLVELFSRVGFPREILTDQGTPFVSRMMGEVCKTLDLTHIRTSAYHPQTDGLVERYNWTLKTTLKKLLGSETKDWDKMLPLALYVVRSQVQSSLGCSPFELLYGRQPRSLLEITREAWEREEAQEQRSLLDYTQQLRSRLGKLRDLAYSNLQSAQSRQKRYYDKGKRRRELNIGDWALVLLPSSTQKFRSEWKGPFQVLEKYGSTTYKIRMSPRRTQSFHINLLKKWLGSVPQPSHLVLPEVRPESTLESLPINPELTEGEKQALRDGLRSFSHLFSDTPGCTHLAEHEIHTAPGSIVKQRAYRIPAAKRADVRREVASMLELEVIRPSKSSWSSPIVMVPKPDGSTRFCMDFRALNAVSTFDAFPIPRVDELIERIGDAKYITTLDLTKGY